MLHCTYSSGRAGKGPHRPAGSPVPSGDQVRHCVEQSPAAAACAPGRAICGGKSVRNEKGVRSGRARTGGDVGGAGILLLLLPDLFVARTRVAVSRVRADMRGMEIGLKSCCQDLSREPSAMVRGWSAAEANPFGGASAEAPTCSSTDCVSARLIPSTTQVASLREAHADSFHHGAPRGQRSRREARDRR
jgi:hypothetical protein